VPKLPDELAKAARRASGDYYYEPPLLAPGVYTGVLLRVEENRNQHGGWWWDWTFEVEGEERRLHFYASLRDENDYGLWKLNLVFSAFGVSTESDTDDMVGKTVRLVVSQREDKYRGGELDNRVDRVLPLGR
jgi:hypothetical protein